MIDIEKWFLTEYAARWGEGSPFKTWVARIFGQRQEGEIGYKRIIGYKLGGFVYVWRRESL